MHDTPKNLTLLTWLLKGVTSETFFLRRQTKELSRLLECLTCFDVFNPLGIAGVGNLGLMGVEFF